MPDVPVFCEGQRVGTIASVNRCASFAYDPAWLAASGAFPISCRMPLSRAPTLPGVFEPWAAHLLPEGPQRRGLARQLGKDPEDILAILAETGRDTPGALSLGGPGVADRATEPPVPDQAALEAMLEGLPEHPLLAGCDGVSMTLGGARPKLAVALDENGRICIPRNGAPSTHILKPDREHLYGGVQNEALCLVLARRCGLDALAVVTGKAGGRDYLLVNRYDRVAQAGHWRRLHQENFDQALGVDTDAGPTLADLLGLARRVMSAPGVLGLIDQFIFNVLICTPDVRASSFSLMLSADGASLAPVHGLASVAPWDGASHRLGQMIASQHIDAPEWEAFAAACGLNAGRLLARVDTLAGAVLGNVREAAEAVAAMPAGPHPLLARLVLAIETRARRHRAIAEGYPACGRRKAATADGSATHSVH